MQWTGLNELREKFLEFFESKEHLRLPSFSLIPQGDNSLLLINSGMAPMKKYFTGEVTPPRRRVTTCQKCIRTGDIENVGYTDRHGTYFEMLGNFSFGDYFKREAISFAWEFFTKVLEMPKDKLYISVYENDDEAWDIWTKEIGVEESHMKRLGKEDNFWEHGSGPCGPCSEIYFDRGEKHGCGKPTCGVGCDCDRFVEVWNLVFSQFNNDGQGNYTDLVQKNIDTGMGLERLACVMQDDIVYIGCGERGNEMTQVLDEFSELIDPKSNRPLLDRTMLIANTSNMPVAAREASIYTGVTIAEYYRDMGYDVALMADSTSRWAEALREISGRLEEMPAEEGFPAYLASRLSAFYERAGYVTNLNGSEGSVSIIGAVSPQGGDFSEPVTQNTKRFIRCFWALDKSLAYARHYPAIQWLNSYSEYIGEVTDWYAQNVSPDFMEKRNKMMAILQEESSLMEIVKLIGADVLPDSQKATLEVAKTIRVGFLQQNAFHADDTYVPLEKQNKMMDTILLFDKRIKECVEKGVVLSKVSESGIAEDIIRIKYTIGNDNIDGPFHDLQRKINETFDKLIYNHES